MAALSAPVSYTTIGTKRIRNNCISHEPAAFWQRAERRKIVKKDIEKDIAFIAHYYGYEAQSRQLIEEMAELTQSINKKWRGENTGLYRGYYDDMKAITEEIADVQICIEQVKLLLGITDKQIESVAESKIIREKSRIREARRKTIS